MPRSSGNLCLSSGQVDGIRVHERARHEPLLPAGPFVRLDSGDLLSVAGNPAQGCLSRDDGRTWHPQPLFPADGSTSAGPTGALLRSTSGAVVLGFSNTAAQHWAWDDELKDAPGARLPTCAMRSVDGGQTWQDQQTLHEEWTGATRHIIQLRDGRIVFTSMQLRHNPGRHAVLCYFSDDDGRSWQRSNVMDLGGNGHHDGVTEGTIVELRDGRLLQYLRTNWGQLWRALSADRGQTWHPYGPSGIPASSAPARLQRLASGRLALLWNRPHAEGEETYPRLGGDGVWSATPASTFRAELSFSLSEDEGETWGPPTVIARNEGTDPARDAELSYPYAFEFEPGVLWITAHRWNLRMSLREEDFLIRTQTRR
ncbi:exo-alpha-sialidase [bacterium]|nr:exo-alpha-sialidase [bacterium]